MGHQKVVFEEIMNQAKTKLGAVKEIDVVIGIPFYNEVDTLGDIVKVAKNSMKEKNRKLIVCAGDPAGEIAMKIIEEDHGDEIVSFLMPLGINGRGFSTRAIF